MIAVDTNLLVYAHGEDSPRHTVAKPRPVELAEGRRAWAIPAPCVHEWLAIVTHHRIDKPPTPLSLALRFVSRVLASPSVVVLSEAAGYWPVLDRLVRAGRPTGPRVHDARIAALCIFHRVDEPWSADRDFGQFSELTTRNPLVA